jgi:type IV secretory pathway VirB3-like protein
MSAVQQDDVFSGTTSNESVFGVSMDDVRLISIFFLIVFFCLSSLSSSLSSLLIVIFLTSTDYFFFISHKDAKNLGGN